MAQRGKVIVHTETQGDDIYHTVKGLPRFQELNSQVKKIVEESTYWERTGKGLAHVGAAIPLHFLGLYLCSSESPIPYFAGFLLLSCCHCVLTNRVGHLAIHNSLFESSRANRFASWVSIEFLGFYSLRAAYDIHVKDHHPYTNIIGRGDSSSWKAPFFPRYVYMFFAPFLLPVLTPIVSLKELKGSIRPSISFLFWISIGIMCNIFIVMKMTGYTSVLNAALFIYSYRAATAVPYIHINIFQHIGLPMYVLKDRPAKLYQMSTGVLNLDRNIFLDWIMGHTLFHCHIEHHLFPMLSDNMVLKIRPFVKQFMLDNGLAYIEQPYMERLSYFVDKYEELMVKAPPFSHYVGLH